MPGSDADIVLVNLDSQRKVNPAEMLSRSDFSLFQGENSACLAYGNHQGWTGCCLERQARRRYL